MTLQETIIEMDAASAKKAKLLDEKGVRCGIVHLTLRPVFTFFGSLATNGRSSCIRRIIQAGMDSYEAFTTYLKLWEIQNVKQGGAR